MARSTIDFGIDFGTTNSAIACFQRDSVEVIKNSLTQSDLTPSAVFVDSKGAVIVGATAYGKLEFDPDNAVAGFKRWLGGDGSFTFQKSRKSMKSEELCAEVLKSLKSDVHARFEENISAAVITVPAVWEIPKCEATRRGAKLAGMDFTPLLQEPIAAAIGYGFQAEELRGVVMVFDLGGGTFDTSLLSAKDGRLVVLGNEGCLLGGRDFDMKLAEWVVTRLQDEFGVPELRRDNPAAQRAFAKLKQAAEEAKKQLSVKDSSRVAIENLGPGFENIETTLEIGRRDYEQLIASDTKKAIGICKALLKSKGLNASSLQALLLVGGPTLTPYVRRSIETELGIRPDATVDPMTVVAKGAALFAATQRLPQTTVVSPGSGEIAVDLHYSPVADSTEVDVGLSLRAAPQGGQIRLFRFDGGWASPFIPIPQDGRLLIPVVLRAKRSNDFRLEIKDSKGNLAVAQPAQFSITHGLLVAQAITSKSFGVALENNEFHVLIPKGTPLPAKGSHSFQTTKSVAVGSQDSALKVYVLEGENPRADRNVEILVMELRGTNCKRSLPEGQTVVVTFRIDESRLLSATAHIELLNQTIDAAAPLQTRISGGNPAEVKAELEKELGRSEEVREVAPDDVSILEFQRKAAELKEQLNAASAGDQEARQKVLGDLLDLKATLDIAENSTKWQRLLSELTALKETARDLFSANGTEEQRSQLELLIKEADLAVSKKSPEILDGKLESIRSMYWRLLFSFDEYWIAAFRRLEEGETRFSDPGTAGRLIEEGKRALGRQDVESLKTIVPQLWGVLANSQQSKFDFRFADAGLRRAYGRQR
jgi:molecular chaperone DnaK